MARGRAVRRAKDVTDPETLAFIQTLAGHDPRISLTLKMGRHRNVLTYIDRLTTDEPGSLPPLSGPLLNDPEELANP